MSLPEAGGARQRSCPRCRASMTAYQDQGVMAAVCPTCHGLWFDGGDLGRFVGTPVELTEATGGTSGTCARCLLPLREASVRAAPGLRLSTCGVCSGVFLAAGELRRLLELRTRRAARTRAEDVALRRKIADEQAEKKRYLRSGAKKGIELESWSNTDQGLLAWLLGLPTEVDTTLSRRPYVIYGLVALLSSIWLWQLSVGLAESVKRFGEVPNEILAGQRVSTLVTATFIHGGWLHLLGNLYFLWLFGDNVEDRLRSLPFLAWYLVWGICAGLFSVVLCKGGVCDLPHLGASGAISGTLGAYFVLFPHNRIAQRFLYWLVLRLPAWMYLGVWIALQLVSGVGGGEGIDWWAHVGGFLAGALVAAFYRARWPEREE